MKNVLTVDGSNIGALVNIAKVYIHLFNKQESLANTACELNISRNNVALATRQLHHYRLIEHTGNDIVCNSDGYPSLRPAYQSVNPIRASLKLVEKKFDLPTYIYQ